MDRSFAVQERGVCNAVRSMVGAPGRTSTVPRSNGGAPSSENPSSTGGSGPSPKKEKPPGVRGARGGREIPAPPPRGSYPLRFMGLRAATVGGDAHTGRVGWVCLCAGRGG